MRADKMPVGHFEMAPLDEFVVTERKYPNRKQLPRMQAGEWFSSLPEGWPQYYFDDDTHQMRIELEKPDDVEVSYLDWEIVFLGKDS